MKKMINSHAFRSNRSEVLRAECHHLLTQMDKFKSRRFEFAPWIPIPMIIGLASAVVTSAVVSMFLLVKYALSGYIDPVYGYLILAPSVSMFIVFTGLMYISEHGDHENIEVSDRFYDLLTAKAEAFPDIAMAVDGYEALSNFEARAALNRLLNLLDEEVIKKPPRHSNSRRNFQEVSLSDKSSLGESS